ncbi:endothelin-converting enzyme 1-like isoform X2 [Apostichopus japonicus]
MALTITSIISLISVSLALAFCSHDSLAHPRVSSGSSEYAQIIDSLDETVDPCDNFYEYACGGWKSTQTVPTGHSKWNTFNIVEMENKAAMKEMFGSEDTSYKGQESSAFRKTKDYYKACMDLDRTGLLGAQPLIDLVHKFGGWPLFGEDISAGGWNQSSYNLTLLLIASNKITVSPFFNMWVGADDRNSSRNIVQFEQSGLGLQFPEMYEGPSMDAIVEGYKVLGAKTAAYLHKGKDWESFYDIALTRFQDIIDFEIEMSHIYVPKREMQDPTATYHKMQLKEFGAMFPMVDISLFMQEIFGEVIPLTEEVIVYTPSFFPKLTHLLQNTPEKLIVDYFMWQMLQPFLTYVSAPFENLYREFQEIFSGTPDLPPRWQRCVSRTDSAFGFATGAMFVETILPQNIKEAAVEMIEEVKSAFIGTLPENEWMDDTTREKARQKAEAIVDRVGHPEWIEDPRALDNYYSEAEIDPHQFFNNYINMRTFTLNILLQERGKPANSSKWDMTPAAVNAYYNPSHNQIVFPSGIFQRPFYNTQMPMAMNFGGIGMVMGHELTHGFDNQGRKYDLHGNLQDWWEEAASANFTVRSECMVDQYQQYTVESEGGTIHVDGNYTLPENIADNGGLVIAYKAYQSWKSAHPADDHPLPGLNLNPDQLYFLGFAQIWCSFQTPEHAHLSVLSDQHAPDKYRVVGSISNSVEFAEAFSCPTGSAMNPRHKCKIW